MTFVDVTDDGLFVRRLLCTCCRLAQRVELWEGTGRGKNTRFVPVSATVTYLSGPPRRALPWSTGAWPDDTQDGAQFSGLASASRTEPGGAAQASTTPRSVPPGGRLKSPVPASGAVIVRPSPTDVVQPWLLVSVGLREETSPCQRVGAGVGDRRERSLGESLDALARAGSYCRPLLELISCALPGWQVGSASRHRVRLWPDDRGEGPCPLPHGHAKSIDVVVFL
jgi:hypothetical protein